MTSTSKRMHTDCFGRRLYLSPGIAAGSIHARSVAAQNRFGQPKTVLHVVIYKFKDTVSNYDRDNAINGIKEMAGKIPGIKNIWIKTERNQLKDFSGVYAIEFTSRRRCCRLLREPGARSVVEEMAGTAREQPLFPDFEPIENLPADRLRLRLAAYLFRDDNSESPAKDGVHALVRQEPLAPLRDDCQLGNEIANLRIRRFHRRRITRAQSSGVVFDLARAPVTLAKNRA